MVCGNCGNDSLRVVITTTREYCENCSRINATGGARISGILTRQSSRVQSDQAHHKADVVSPHRYDSTSGRVVPNPDFIKLYPQHTANYYTQEEIAASGDRKLTELWDTQDAERAAHKEALGDLDTTPVTYTKNEKKEIEHKIEDL